MINFLRLRFTSNIIGFSKVVIDPWKNRPIVRGYQRSSGDLAWELVLTIMTTSARTNHSTVKYSNISPSSGCSAGSVESA